MGDLVVISDGSDVLQQISQIQIPASLIERLDMNNVSERFSILMTQLDDTQKDMKELADAGFLKKFLWAISGKTTNLQLSAQQTQAEMAKLQSFMILLNTMFAKGIDSQQKTVIRQQEILDQQNKEILSVQKEIKEQNDKLNKSQEAILELVEHEKVLIEKVENALGKIRKEINTHSEKIASDLNLMQNSINQVDYRVSEQERNSITTRYTLNKKVTILFATSTIVAIILFVVCLML